LNAKLAKAPTPANAFFGCPSYPECREILPID